MDALEQAEASEFGYCNATTSLAFLILALGAISEDRNDISNNLTSGLEYFARGCHVLESTSVAICLDLG